jgi:hypothetical protein
MCVDVAEPISSFTPWSVNDAAAKDHLKLQSDIEIKFRILPQA